MGMDYEDDDLEPFCSEARDEALPPRWRLGNLLYLEAREHIVRALADGVRPEGSVPPVDAGIPGKGPICP